MLEQAYYELRNHIENQQQEEMEDEDLDEEVKQEIPIENITELAKRLNCDSSNPEELRSLQLALQLQAEERRQQLREAREQMQKLAHDEQDEALQALDHDPQSAVNVNPDVMTYEQLLELEDKMGSVCKGLTQEEIAVLNFM